jgi:glycosyltransferase involved in cell wall biosynthesis
MVGCYFKVYSGDKMNVAIIGNPITNISSGKFIEKYSKIFETLSDKVYIINDGVFKLDDPKYIVIPSTRCARIVKNMSLSYSYFFSFLSFLMSQIGSTFGLLKCARKVDVVIVFPITLFLPVIIAKIMRKKIVLYQAQDIFSEWSDSCLAAKVKFKILLYSREIVLRCATSIIIEGYHVVDDSFRERYKSKIQVCPPYVYDHYLVNKPLNLRERKIGFVATLDSRKGALEFAQAVKLLSGYKDFTFTIVGDGELKFGIRSLLADEIDKKSVQQLDSLDEQYFTTFLSGLKLLVLPSRSEGLPNIILESMACGTPVLATPVGAIPDIIIDGETGFLMADNQPRCIAENIVRALESSNLEIIVYNAQKLIRDEYSLQKVRDRYKILFQDLRVV